MKIKFVNYQHEVILQPYLDMVLDSIDKIVREPDVKKDYIDIFQAIIDYSNLYDSITNDGNFHDYLNIIPLQISTMTSGFFCGYENKYNQHEVRIYRQILAEYASKVIGELKEIQPHEE